MRMFKKKKKGGEKIYITEQNFHCENFQNNKRRKGKNTKKKKKKKKNFFLIFYSFLSKSLCVRAVYAVQRNNNNNTRRTAVRPREREECRNGFMTLFSPIQLKGGAAFLSKISQFFVVLCVPVGGTFSSSKKRRGRRRKKKS
jgi:hypothetical protein